MADYLFNPDPQRFYQNEGYSFNYFETKKLVLIYSSNASLTTNIYPVGNSTNPVNASSALYESSDNGKFKFVISLLIDGPLKDVNKNEVFYL